MPAWLTVAISLFLCLFVVAVLVAAVGGPGRVPALWVVFGCGVLLFVAMWVQMVVHAIQSRDD